MLTNRIKTPYVPMLVGFICGTAVFGLGIALTHWHWPAWLIWIISPPLCVIMAFVLFRLLNVTVGRFIFGKHNPPKAGDGAA